ncbi:hypothetical protein KL942_000637 [Ogataea angusta]|uniref:Uncharacterized protein n=1 Tax=Pichia angusta TaxID=870730 RepID=A0ABQ7S2T8_PICAN|nr:hypothetical protein KL942_000637 [Ogataea angusta]KAG7852306.1 hypothetical protein KL940_000007 [Ogataea angusta]KAG7863947.1 hypothetical protein KL919_001262 [Ogataea angusta]
MSLRKSLYKQNLRNTAFPLNTSDSNIEDRYWIRDWYHPQKVSKETNLSHQNTLSAQSPSGVLTPHESTPQPQQYHQLSQSQTPQPLKAYGFKVKAWITVERDPYKDCIDEDDDTVLSLKDHPYLSSILASKDFSSNGTGGLTDADIKSAVSGTGDGNRLFSSSAQHELQGSKILATDSPSHQE